MPEVSLQEVGKHFAEIAAVETVSFDVESKELLVLLGPSGCGKTTTLRMIAGLEEPDAGAISIRGKCVSDPQRGVFMPTEKRGIGMVFQSYAIWPNMTVFENVAYPLRVRRVSQDALREKVRQSLALVGLEGLESRPATKLSGGQQQRVALARAIVFEPALLLLDEPLSNLDAKLRVQMRVELKKLLQRTGITTVYVTHDQAESMALADRIVVMNQGHVEQIGTPQEVYEKPHTPFVADFVGSTNMFAAEIANPTTGRGYVCVRIAPRGVELYCPALEERSLQEGEKLLISIRPEKIALRAQRPGDPLNVWECRVESALYYGDRREYDLVCNGTALKAVTGSAPALAVGQTTFAVMDPEDLVLLPWAR
ncbi:MAG: ABC transporter ATP-binding protein [Candidatus Binatia bacterium]